MVMPSSIPLLLGSFTWKVPLLGTTDSDQVWKNKREWEQAETSLRKRSATPPTCDIKLDFHRDLIGQSGVPEQLVGFFQCAVFCWDPIDRQQSVPHLQQSTPGHKTKVTG